MIKNLFSLEGKSVAVIGAGSGIGQAVAIGTAQQGALRLLPRINTDNAAETAAMITKAGGAADAGAVDITDRSVGERCHRRRRRRSTIASTAWSARRPSTCASRSSSTRGDEFDSVVHVNLRGNFDVLHGGRRLMMTAQRSGSIVLFSSIRSIVTEPGQSVYSMTKAGILQLVKTAATEWGTTGVRVNAVGPGVIETPLTAPIKENPDWYNAYAMKNPMNRWAQARRWPGRRCSCCRTRPVT